MLPQVMQGQNMNTITIQQRRIGRGEFPFVIAEMSGNHNHSLDRALAIVDAAADAGVDAVKLQTYTPETMTLDIDDPRFTINDPKSLWAGRTLHSLYAEAMTPWEWHRPIFERCRERGVVPFSTPFDASAVELLESLDCPVYKIASSENIDLPLIRRAASTGKPMIISTGMAEISELDEAVRAARDAGCGDLVLLKCTAAYPAAPESINLATIPHLRDLFGVEVGLSDHTMGIGVAVAAVALGATVIEKHFTLARSEGGVDSAFSMEPQEMRDLVDECRKARAAVGRVFYGVEESERVSRRFRRSLFIVCDMEPGETITGDSIRALRPGDGLPPKYIERLIGKRVNRAVRRGTPASWDLIG